MWIYLLIISVILGILGYAAVKYGKTIDNTNLFKDKNFLIVIAHPDDEVMFMTPTIKRLLQQKGNQLFLLCFSTGNADGLGKIRSNELKESCKNLGISQVDIIHNEELFPDSMKIKWDADKIATTLKEKLVVFKNKIDIILTFDEHGVSSHTNHIEVSKG